MISCPLQTQNCMTTSNGASISWGWEWCGRLLRGPRPTSLRWSSWSISSVRRHLSLVGAHKRSLKRRICGGGDLASVPLNSQAVQRRQLLLVRGDHQRLQIPFKTTISPITRMGTRCSAIARSTNFPVLLYQSQLSFDRSTQTTKSISCKISLSNTGKQSLLSI